MKQIFASENISYVQVSTRLIRDYLVMVNDRENVSRFIGGSDCTYTEEQERKWVRGKQRQKAPVFSMLEKSTGEFIGNIELMDVRDGAGELGIAITAAKQNMGYGAEAISALTDYAVRQMGLRRIFLRTRPFNARAIHVYEKCGFREYKRTEDHVFMELKR